MNRKFRVILLLSLSLLISVSLFAGGQSEPNAAAEGPAAEQTVGESVQFPMTVTDGLGNEMVIERLPERIASLTLFSDEVLFELVGPERLAAVTFLASDPVYSNIADQADVFSVQLDLNVEALIDIFPDIIFTADWSDAAKVEQLRQAGLTVYALSTPFTIEGIQREILQLGTIVGAEDEARNLIDEMNRSLDDLRETVDGAISAGTVGTRRVMDYSTWGSASGVDTTFQAMLDAAGAVNAVAELEAGDFGQVPVSKEVLVEQNPDVLVLPGFIWGDPDGAENFLEETTGDPALAGVAAVVEGRTFLMPEHLKSTYSQYIVDGIYFLAENVYPEAFAE